ncbi:MAG: BrnT family toxin [Rhizobiales bacterium]|nr:BrnT family toxin [Hyphomicrobiales bacterium]MBI3672953.1 BrnT family toxin [Hyphomicrobiales bacterium]
MFRGIHGFDWDEGNRDKCRKHGVAIATIEALFRTSQLLVQQDVANSKAETRFKAIGKTAGGRSIFVVFTFRDRDGLRLIRPVSARHMHNKEIAAYEKENP